MGPPNFQRSGKIVVDSPSNLPQNYLVTGSLYRHLQTQQKYNDLFGAENSGYTTTYLRCSVQ